jgi:hypothetical protein
MLVQEPSRDGPRSTVTTPARPRSRASYAFLTLAAIAVLVMRHDYWFWDTPYPLMFGCLPVALWWQAVVSLSACVLMWLMVRLAWPQELEDEALQMEQRQVPSGAGDGSSAGRHPSEG